MGSVENLGLLIFLALMCLVLAVEFIALGVTFLLRTVIIFILFAASPLAVIAGLTEEFRPWFERWLMATQAMLVAPIPVAISLRMVQSFSNPEQLSSAATNPPQFLLQLIYLASFLLIAAILQFKIAGSVGGFIFGAAVGGLALAGGFVAGALLGRGKSAAVEDKEETRDQSRSRGASSSSRLSNNPSSNQFNGNSGPLALPAGYSAANTNNSGMGESIAANDLAKSIRGMNENLALINSSRSSTTLGSWSSGSGSGHGFSGGSSHSFHPGVARGIQDTLIWAGREAGVSAPYYNFGYGMGAGSYRGEGNTDIGNNSQIIYHTEDEVRQTAVYQLGNGGNPSSGSAGASFGGGGDEGGSPNPMTVVIKGGPGGVGNLGPAGAVSYALPAGGSSNDNSDPTRPVHFWLPAGYSRPNRSLNSNNFGAPVGSSIGPIGQPPLEANKAIVTGGNGAAFFSPNKSPTPFSGNYRPIEVENNRAIPDPYGED